MRKLLKADVAQLVEQPIRNRQVIGSSPIVGSITLHHDGESATWPLMSLPGLDRLFHLNLSVSLLLLEFLAVTHATLPSSWQS